MSSFLAAEVNCATPTTATSPVQPYKTGDVVQISCSVRIQLFQVQAAH